MNTDCTSKRYEFQRLGRRQVVASFDGGEISSDGGAVLLREIERRRQLLSRFAACFEDHRDPERIEHSVEELVRSGFSGSCWVTRTSTTTRICAVIRC